ncbi:MAG TPA: HNH endonuclease [Ignavibacteria bacterium]|nr:HNH endonuclease [Ignavibacteria bacterium]
MNDNYSKHLRNPKWFAKRKAVLKRDKNKCRICGAGKNLVVHHRQYHIDKKCGRFINCWDYKMKYLITLCRRCHELGHKQFIIRNYKFNITN